MKTPAELYAMRDRLLIHMHTRRQLMRVSSVPGIAIQSGNARSATMRFILHRPHLCLWVLGEVVPFLFSKMPGKAGKRFARAFVADQSRFADGA